jgi:hypothetical protein
MKNKIFKIVGAFSFFISMIALLGSLGMAFIGGSSFLSEVDTNINKPIYTVEDYVKSKSSTEPQKQDTTKIDEPTQKNDEEDAEYQKQLSESLDKIAKYIDNFGTITKQGTANRKGLEKWLIKATNETNRDEYLDFLRSLSKALLTLENKAEKISAMEADDPQYVEWEDFISWYVASYMVDFNAEKHRIALEELKAQTKSAEGLTQLMVAGSMFTLFVLFVLIMLLVQIESNTRKQEA